MNSLQESTATFSPCRTYRYSLWRRWGAPASANAAGSEAATATAAASVGTGTAWGAAGATGATGAVWGCSCADTESVM